jgi:hypothetical protein
MVIAHLKLGHSLPTASTVPATSPIWTLAVRTRMSTSPSRISTDLRILWLLRLKFPWKPHSKTSLRSTTQA